MNIFEDDLLVAGHADSSSETSESDQEQEHMEPEVERAPEEPDDHQETTTQQELTEEPTVEVEQRTRPPRPDPPPRRSLRNRKPPAKFGEYAMMQQPEWLGKVELLKSLAADDTFARTCAEIYVKG